MPTALQNVSGFNQAPYRSARAEKPASPPALSEYDLASRDTVKLDGRQASWMTDAIAVAQFVGSGLLYKDSAKEAAAEFAKNPPLADAPKVKLEDPFLILPGWTTQPEKFDDLINHLLKNPENGNRAVYLKENKAYSDKECTQPTTIGDQDKVFLAVYDSVLSPPDKTAPQIADAVGMIKEKFGPKVDVLGYSMGGLAVRKMLDSNLETVDQVAFLGSAHHGARFAALANYIIRRDIEFAMNLANINAAHLPAMEWMMPVTPQSQDYSVKLTSLNDTIEQQKANANEMVNIRADGFATITKSWGGTVGGDGLVHHTSASLEGVPEVTLKGRGTKQHGSLPSDTESFLALKEFFGWSAAS